MQFHKRFGVVCIESNGIGELVIGILQEYIYIYMHYPHHLSLYSVVNR